MNEEIKITDVEPESILFLNSEGKLEFEGDMEESARILLEEFLKPMVDDYIAEKLKKERNEIIKQASNDVGGNLEVNT